MFFLRHSVHVVIMELIGLSYLLSSVESEYLYTVPNSLISHNGAGRWITGAGKAESLAFVY